MFNWFMELSPIYQALIATCFTWAVTALGAALVVFAKNVSQKFLDLSLGAAAGVMIAASFWSLLSPAIEMSEHDQFYAQNGLTWLPAAIGFLLGGVVLRIIDKLLPHMHPDLKVAEGLKSSWQRSTLLVLAITIHNIPEGIAVGVAFGAAKIMADNHGFGSPEHITQLGGAIALAIGIGIQNFPEGSAVSLPLRREGMGRFKAFWYGQLSAAVEPIGGLLGVIAVTTMTFILPYALAFAAGAMIFVVVEELIPESHRNQNVDLATMGAMGGFAIMMILDVGLG